MLLHLGQFQHVQMDIAPGAWVEGSARGELPRSSNSLLQDTAGTALHHTVSHHAALHCTALPWHGALANGGRDVCNHVLTPQ